MNGIIWSKIANNFVPLFSISTFSERKNEFLKRSRQLEKHNFQKDVLKITYYEEENLLNFVDNDTKISGACGDIWTVLADYLNFTLVPVRSKTKKFGNKLNDSSYDGLLGMLDKKQADAIPRVGILTNHVSFLDYTIPFWRVNYKLYIKPELKDDEVWMVRLFDAQVWISIFSLLVIFVIAGYICDRNFTKSSQSKKNGNFHDHVFYTLAIALSLGSVPHEIYAKSKLVYFHLSMFSWLIFIAINSHAIIHMMNKEILLPFTDIRSLLHETSYYIHAFKGSMVNEQFDAIVWRDVKNVADYSRILYDPSTPTVFDEVCSNPDMEYAAFEAEDNYRAIGRHFCALIPAGKSYFATWIGSAMKRGFKYKRSFDIGILKMEEMGLIDRLQDYWLDWRLKETHEIPFQSISLSQMYFVFLIFIVGMIMSMFLLLVERLTFSRNNLDKSKNELKVQKDISFKTIL